jgi:hypothetical protein
MHQWGRAMTAALVMLVATASMTAAIAAIAAACFALKAVRLRGQR